MAGAKNHDYHVLPPSIWPLLASVATFVMLFGLAVWISPNSGWQQHPWFFLMGFTGLCYVCFAWWADTVSENQAGDHTPVVMIGLRYGFILFVMSEVMFFAAWFWAFIKRVIYPMQDYAGSEYEFGHYYAVNAFEVPLINTLILLLSGAAITWAHHALIHGNNRRDLIRGLSIGIVLGIIFTGFQAYEYAYLMGNGWPFGGDLFFSAFFMATGFHGLHVIIGTIFLTVCLVRARRGHFTSDNHAGFEMAAWYWHFVDVVWLFLFVLVYLWGANVVLH